MQQIWSYIDIEFTCLKELLVSKIEKVPRGIRGEKSSKRHGKFEEFGLNNWSISKSQNGGRNQVSGRVSVPCWLATPVANAPWKPLIIRWRSSSAVKVMKLVESLIGREVTVGQGSECHLTFVRGLLHIAQQDPPYRP